MTTEYHDNVEDDSSSFWNKEPAPVYFSGVSRFRRWLFPALTATVILILIIALGASKTAKQVVQMQFAVENNKDQLATVAEALKQLSIVDSLSKSVATLKCSLEHIINNSSAGVGCCPIGWEQFGLNCYFFSSLTLSWNESRVWCDKQKAHLLIVHTDKAWDFVTRRTIHEMFWVGLSDWRTGRWEWVNQTPYNIERRRWVPGQPDGWTGHGMGHGDEDCGHLHYDGRLNDVHCTTKMRFICHKHSMRA